MPFPGLYIALIVQLCQLRRDLPERTATSTTATHVE